MILSLTKVCFCHSSGAFWSKACRCCMHTPQKCFIYTYELWTREQRRFLPLKRNISHTIVQQPSFQCVWKIILTLPVVSRKKVENSVIGEHGPTHCPPADPIGEAVPAALWGCGQFQEVWWDFRHTAETLLERGATCSPGWRSWQSLTLTDRCT